MKKWLIGVIRKRGLTFIAGLIFAVFCFIGINTAVDYSSTPEFCVSHCHEMMPAYQSWELSAHGTNKHGIKVACIDCHLPSKDDYFTYLTAKAYTGGKDTLLHFFGDEYDIEKNIDKVSDHLPNERCLKCHNNLLGGTGSAAAKMAHKSVLNSDSDSKMKCIKCHSNVAHQRQNKIFSE